MRRLAAVLAVLSVSSFAACGSAKAPGASSTLTIGLLTDLTGPAASGNKASVQGLSAGLEVAAQRGYHFKLVVADTMTSPAGALSAAEKLVEEDHVDAVVSVSALAFAAASWLTSHDVPVVGAAEDGPEWITAPNMFSVIGRSDPTKVADTLGKFLKLTGATNLGAVGYSISPLSSEAAKSAAASARLVGLQAGYVNTNLPFGTTNVEPIALAMKSAGVDAMYSPTDPNTGLLLVAAMRQQGINLKTAILPNGYGGDLLAGGPGAISSAQGVYFYVPFEPVEMHTAATTQFVSALAKVGVTTGPTLPEYFGYASAALLVDGIRNAATTAPSRLAAGLRAVHRFDAFGLLDGHSEDIGSSTPDTIGPDNCVWFTRLSGTTFNLVSGADPICGALAPGSA